MHKTGRPKRPRALQACEVCRARKNRCSEDQPCKYCVEHDLECTYSRIHSEKRPRTQPNSHFDKQIVMNVNPPRSPQGPISSTIDFWPNHVSQAMGLDENPARSSRTIAIGQNQQQGAASASSTIEEPNHDPSTVVSRQTESDVMETNSHTRNLEFYGSTSSVAFLRHVETLSNSQTTGPSAGSSEKSLASLLHNTDFLPDSSTGLSMGLPEGDPSSGHFHFRVARRFLDAYFSNIHHIQPLFDEEEFLARCEDLWFNRPGKQPLSFVALYYATSSLGSLVMTFDNPKLYGADRFTWSRMLFNDALAIVTRLGTTTDIEMVQCFYMMSKICQHELNPHVAYLYSGQAARTSLAIGINRSPVNPNPVDPRASMAASKIWWAVYCLDIQTSFALGRPDSLGPDQYHTQSLPTTLLASSISSSHSLQIIPCMVSLSRIMRKVALDLYTQPCTMEEKLSRAKGLDADLENWLDQVPQHLQFEQQNTWDLSLKPRRSANYIKKQSVVLQLRYLNLRMVIHAVFIIDVKIATSEESAFLRECRCHCIQAAEDAINLMYSTFCTDDFFQTWWYNSTYTLFAVSILFAVVFRQLARTQAALDNLFATIERAIMVLKAMDDCIVARNATAIIKRTLARARKVPQPGIDAQQSSVSQGADINGLRPPPANEEHLSGFINVDTLLQSHGMDGGDLGEPVDDLDRLSAYAFDDGQQALFWTEWAHEIEILGT